MLSKKLNLFGCLLWLRVLIGLVFFIGVLSCHRQAAVEETPEQRALVLIHEKNYDEALRILGPELVAHPTDRIREIVASIYAAKAGIFVEDYWSFFYGFKPPKDQPADLSQNPEYQSFESLIAKLGNSDLAASGKVLSLLFKNLAKVQEFSERLKLIPLVDEKQKSEIEKGLVVLEPSTSAGAKLYESLLWLILIRKSLTESQQAWELTLQLLKKINLSKIDSTENKKILCAIDQKGFVSWIRRMAVVLSKVATNLSVSFPSQADDYGQALVWLKPLQEISIQVEVCQ